MLVHAPGRGGEVSTHEHTHAPTHSYSFVCVGLTHPITLACTHTNLHSRTHSPMQLIHSHMHARCCGACVADTSVYARCDCDGRSVGRPAWPGRMEASRSRRPRVRTHTHTHIRAHAHACKGDRERERLCMCRGKHTHVHVHTQTQTTDTGTIPRSACAPPASHARTHCLVYDWGGGSAAVRRLG
jgi:hypothetical protein